jgi:hypothetical protein
MQDSRNLLCSGGSSSVGVGSGAGVSVVVGGGSFFH